MLATAPSPLRGLLCCLALAIPTVNGLLQCPEKPGWEVHADGGGTGNRWKIPGDLVLIRTPLKKEDGELNGTWTHIDVKFSVTSAFDDEVLPCHGEATTETPGNYTQENPGLGYVNGTCKYSGTIMGPVVTHFQYNLDYTKADMYMYQDFTCNRTANGRPWRVHADCLNKPIDISCDDDALTTCGSPYPVDFGVYYVPLYPPPPLTNCSAGMMEKDVPFIITNISYNSVQSSDRAPVLGAAYVELTLPLIDFTMRCLPSGDEMAWTFNGTSNTWYDCSTDFTNPPDMPATWIKFNHTTFEVSVLQEFSCDDTDNANPQYVTASGTTVVPRDCARTWNGIDCWSTKEATIMANNVTHSSTRPVPHRMPINGGSRGARVSSKKSPEIKKMELDLLVKANAIKKELVKPSRLVELQGNPI